MRCRAILSRSVRFRLAACAGAVGFSACGAVNTRPYLTPLPGALVDTLQVGPAVVVRQLVTQVTAEGVPIRVVAAEEGFLETRWHELESHDEEGRNAPHSRSTIRLRFFADPVAENQTQLTSEAVTLGLLDPSLSERARERLLAPDHPGSDLVRRIVAAVDTALGTAPP